MASKFTEEIALAVREYMKDPAFLGRDEFSTGKVLWVMPATTTGYTDFVAQHPAYSNGVAAVYTTLSAANTAASDWDVIKLSGGDFDEGAVVNITNQGLKIFGPGNANQHTSMLLASAANHIILTINAHNVEIAGVGFTQTNAKSAIEISTTASYHKCHIHDCRFDGYGAGTYGVKTDGTNGTYDSPDVIIENNRFHSWQTAAIYLNATRAVCRNNLVHTVAAKIGIELVPTTSNRPGTFITDNYVMGVNSTDTGIKITNSPDAGTYFIAKNYILGCATTITQKANNAYCTANNYTSDGAGGALIDTVA
jgi:hypothetical protein